MIMDDADDGYDDALMPPGPWPQPLISGWNKQWSSTYYILLLIKKNWAL